MAHFISSLDDSVLTWLMLIFPKLNTPHFHSHACQKRETPPGVKMWLFYFIITLFIMMYTDKYFFLLEPRNFYGDSTFPRCENWQLWGNMLRVKLAKPHTHSRERARWDCSSKLLRKKLMVRHWKLVTTHTVKHHTSL